MIMRPVCHRPYGPVYAEPFLVKKAFLRRSVTISANGLSPSGNPPGICARLWQGRWFGSMITGPCSSTATSHPITGTCACIKSCARQVSARHSDQYGILSPGITAPVSGWVLMVPGGSWPFFRIPGPQVPVLRSIGTATPPRSKLSAMAWPVGILRAAISGCDDWSEARTVISRTVANAPFV